jgi:hypothetical protein
LLRSHTLECVCFWMVLIITCTMGKRGDLRTHTQLPSCLLHHCLPVYIFMIIMSSLVLFPACTWQCGRGRTLIRNQSCLLLFFTLDSLRAFFHSSLSSRSFISGSIVFLPTIFPASWILSLSNKGFRFGIRLAAFLVALGALIR